MFYGSNGIYKGKRSNRPVIDYNVAYEKAADLDKSFKKLLRLFPKKTISNREVAFWMDVMCQSFTILTAYTMMGRGFKITVKDNKAAQKKIRAFNDRINIRGETINDYILYSWIDNIIHGFSLWRISPYIKGIDDEVIPGPDIQRVPPETIKVETDQLNGWRKFIQIAGAFRTFSTPQQFLKNMLPVDTTKNNQTVLITIPDDQRLVLYSSFFPKPPMDSVIPFVDLKYNILSFMRKFSEKMWAPLMLAYVGDKDHWPNGPIEMNKALQSVVGSLLKIRNFSSTAFPGNTRIDVHEPSGNGEIYIKFFDKMDQQIMFGLFSSVAARETTGVYKGNALADETTVMFLEGIRDKIAQTLRRFYVMNITQDIDESDIEFTWPELRTTSIDNLVKLFQVSLTGGIFKDAQEKRRVLAQAFPFLQEEELSEIEAATLDKQFLDLNKPSEPKQNGTKSGSKSGTEKGSPGKSDKSNQ